MRLSKSLIAKFQQAHLEKFGEAISAGTAETELLGLAELVEITGRAHHAAENAPEDGDKDGSE